MRRLGPPSEIGQLAAPVARVIDAAWQRMHWWIAAMVVCYALSGITVVKPDEAAVILRWGRLVGDTPALQQHGPGLLFALPRPMDHVVRVPVKRVSEVGVYTLIVSEEDAENLDPVTQGYALTGDQNIVHAAVMARYRVRDPAEWAFHVTNAEEVLKVEVTAALVRTLGEMGVDRVLADGRKDLIAAATRRAQAGLDAVHAGIELASLELTTLMPPIVLASDFAAVQSAFIEAETNRKAAQAFAETAIPEAQAWANAAIQSARGEADAELAQANGDADAFRALDREYRTNAVVVRERLYRDAVERAVGAAGQVRWVPPPVGARYSGFRITLQQSGTGSPGAPQTQSSPVSPLVPVPSVPVLPPTPSPRRSTPVTPAEEDDDR